MRMQRLFRDLDIQFEAEQLRTLENQAQRRARMQYLAVTMRERCAAQHGSRIKVCGTDGTVREGCLEAIGQGWIQLSTGTREYPYSRIEHPVVGMRESGGKGQG